MRRFLPVFAALLCAPAVGQIRVVNYNTLDGPTPGVHDNSANMSTIFAGIAAQSVNGIAKRPDLIILQEQTNTSAAALATLLNTQFGLSGAYVAVLPAGQPSSADPIFIDRQAFVYDSTALQLIGSGTSIATGAHRPVIRAQFRPVGYSSSAASFYAYGAHLMASSAPDRDLQTAAMRANSNALGEIHALYAGDFNMQNNQESGWQNLVTGAGAGLAIDPLNPNNNSQTWNNNSAFASIHTQSTRTTATPDNDGGVSGGMDDRFDVQLSTQEFHDGEGLSYIANSYRAYGQDGQHFNDPINIAPFPLGSTIANALWDASDHLPVVADYQLPAKMGFTKSVGEPAAVIIGASATAAVRVQNVAPVSTVNGADELDYTIATTGAGVGSFAGTTNATAAGNQHIITLNTSTAGAKSATVNANSSSQGAADNAASIQLSTTVLAHAVPSLQSGTVTTSSTIDFGTWARGESVPAAAVALFNQVNVPGFTAALDLDGISGSGNTSAFLLNLASGGATIASGASRSGTLSLSSTNIGSLAAVFTLSTSDQDIPGATAFAGLTIIATGRIALAGDANLDARVDIGDFATLAGNFNTSSQIWQGGDFTHDGVVDIADFAILAGNFNQTAPRGSVPEPCGFLAVVFVILRYSEGSSRLPKRLRRCGHHESSSFSEA